MKTALTIFCALLAAGNVWAQKKDPVQWVLTSEVSSAPPGTQVPLRFTATIQPGWHIYAPTIPGPSPRPTTFDVSSPAIEQHTIYQPEPERKLDPTIDLDTEMFENSVSFWIPVKLSESATGDAQITAEANYQVCDDRECLRPTEKSSTVTIKVDPAAPAPAAFLIPAGYSDISIKTVAPPQETGLLSFALIAFGAGLASIFTPCVFPMIPITVSFFLGQRGGILQAVVFAAGIIGMFTGLALALTAALGPFGVVQMSANPWVNGFIALVFAAFAMNLLGAFEISLPSGLLTKMDHASRRGGYFGTLLMGLTFSLTSFACVGPFVGSLLVTSVQSTSLTQPMIGMASFATGLASPFFFLAAFPSYLKKLPRSGGWLARVKVVMAFVLLAVMFKYLSNIDLVLQTGLLTRERYLAAWVVLFAMPGLYLLGQLRLEGVERDEPLGIGRLLTACGFLVFAFSLLPGMFGGSLGELDAYVPVSANPAQSTGPTWMKDQYQEALDIGRRENKLVLVTFTGYTCTNCHWMKANMFTKPEIAAAVDGFVRVELYTDGVDATSEANEKLQDRYDTVSQPLYVLMQPDETVVAKFLGSTRDERAFLAFLNTRG